MPAAVFGVLVVMPLLADCVPLGSVKSTVPPALRLMLPRLSSSGFDVLADGTMADEPGLTIRPLNCWLLVAPSVPWMAKVPPPKTRDEESARLLMMLAVGAPAWLKSSLSVPAEIVVPPL